MQEEANASSQDFERATLIVRRLFIGQVTGNHDGWPRLRTVLRIQTDVFNGQTGEQMGADERYLVSSLPSLRLTPQHWLLVIRRHWGVETSHQILDTAFAEDEHPRIEANPRAALVVALLPASLTPCSPSFAALPSAPTSAERCPGKR